MKKTALEYALYLLKIRDRAIGELRAKLSRKGFLIEEIDQTINFLVNKHFLDDERFVTNFLKSKLNSKPQGRYKLTAKLSNLKLPKDLIDHGISEVYSPKEAELAVECANRWIKRNGHKEDLYPKLCQHLAGRGFSYDIIKETVDKILN